MGSHGRRPGPADSSGYPPVKSRWSGIRRGGDLSSERRCPPRMPSNFHISHKNHWTTGKKMYRVLTSYGTTARSSCGRQATRALVRPVYQPIQTVGAEKDRTRRHPGPDGSGPVLSVLLGHATKISGYLMAGGVKAYQGTVRLGQTTDTWDADGQRLPPKRRGTM